MNPGTSEDEQKIEFKKMVMTAVGFKGDEVAKMDVGAISDTEIQSLVKQKLLGVMTKNGAKQKVVPRGEVETHVSQG